MKKFLVILLASLTMLTSAVMFVGCLDDVDNKPNNNTTQTPGGGSGGGGNGGGSDGGSGSGSGGESSVPGKPVITPDGDGIQFPLM